MRTRSPIAEKVNICEVYTKGPIAMKQKKLPGPFRKERSIKRDLGAWQLKGLQK